MLRQTNAKRIEWSHRYAEMLVCAWAGQQRPVHLNIGVAPFWKGPLSLCDKFWLEPRDMQLETETNQMHNCNFG